MARLLGYAVLVMPLVALAEGFVIQDMSGKTHRLADYRGKWVVVNYWATWCPPCLEEIPDLIALHESRRDLVVIGVALEYDHPATVRRFVDDNLMYYPVVLGDEKVVSQIGAASVLPTTFIYDPQGRLVKTRHGLITRGIIEKTMAGR